MEGCPGNDSGLIVVLKLLAMTTWVELRKVKSSWAPLVTPIGVSASSRGDSLDLTANGLANPGGAAVSHPHAFWGVATITPGLIALSGSEASSGQLGVCGVVAYSSRALGLSQ